MAPRSSAAEKSPPSNLPPSREKAIEQGGGPYPSPAVRALITVSSMLATIMVAVDGTIANVVLPHIQAAVGASPEQIVWVLTSYFIASAISTPLSGWLAGRYGRKRVMLCSVGGFTLASIACGAATSLSGLVVCRFFQGFSGAGVVPLSQASMMDINPPERQSQALAIYGLGSVLGPFMGPLIGGYITDSANWRWCFYVNMPFGVLAFLGLLIFMSETRRANTARFDLMGFASLSIFLASLQLMLDRGQQLDWFDSSEICIDATLAAAFLYITVVHTLTTANSFIKPSIFLNRNFLLGSVVSIEFGILLFGIPPMLAAMLQNLMGYPPLLAGLSIAPRGFGTMLAMAIIGRLASRFDLRYIITFGLLLSAVALYQYSHFPLAIETWRVMLAGLIQGLGAGFVFLPLTILVFSAIDPRDRNEGTALFSLSRSVGGAIGVTVLQTMTIRNTATVQSRLVEQVRPDNPILAMRAPDFDFDRPGSVAPMVREIGRQAGMVAYNDTFWFLLILTFGGIAAALAMRSPRQLAAARAAAVAD